MDVTSQPHHHLLGVRREIEELPGLALSHVEAVADGRPSDAINALSTLLDSAPPSFVGWTFPIEAMFLGLRAEPGFQQVLARLAERAK